MNKYVESERTVTTFLVVEQNKEKGWNLNNKSKENVRKKSI
jgi:hypothetical protein